MKWLVFIFIILIAAVGFALFAQDEQGYVLIAAGDWTVEGTVTLFAALLVLLVALSYAAIRLLVRMLEIPGRVRHWRAERRHSIAARYLANGLLAQAEGRWAKAEQLLLKHVAESRTPELNYLAAAQVSQAQGSIERRDRYLRFAHDHRPQNDIAVGLTQAHLQIDQGQFEQALATLQHLQQQEPKHAPILTALARVYSELREWRALLQLLKPLRKYKVYPQARLDEQEKNAYVQLLNDRHATAPQRSQLWASIPRQLRYQPDIVLAYVRSLFALRESDLAESTLRTALTKNWDTELARQYGLLEGTHSLSQLSYAESWLLKHREDTGLLLTLGRLCMRERLWGKARDYLEASLSLKPSLEAYHLLAILLDQLGEPERALRYYRAGLQLATGHFVPVPNSASGLEKKESRDLLTPSRRALPRPFNRPA